MTNAEIQLGVEALDHSAVTETEVPRNTEPAQTAHEGDHVLQAPDDDAPSLASDSAAVYADIEDLDSHKTGIAVACPTQDDNIGADVVAIHGIHGHSRKSWVTISDKEQIWLHDAFTAKPSKVARVIMYGYDAMDSSKSFFTSQGIHREAEALLVQLLVLRDKSVKSSRRPLVFVSHDIGGLIVKMALVLATHDKERFSSILNSTRVLVFFGYPHRPLTTDDLEEQIFRLLFLQTSVKQHNYDPLLVERLSGTIFEINGSFLHTKMLTQAIICNIHSKHPEPSHRVFDHCTATLGIDGEYRLAKKSAHMALTVDNGSGTYPLMIPSGGTGKWLRTEEQKADCVLTAMQRLLEQMPPLYPSMDFEIFADSHGHLKDFAKSKASRIVHIQCDADAQSISEQCRNYLDQEKGDRQVLSYFAFNAHDVRSSSLVPMFASFFAHFSHKLTLSLETDDIIAGFADPAEWSRDKLNICWHDLKQSPAISDSLYVLGCFDECCESDALWFLSEVQRTMEMADGYKRRMKLVIVTSKDTTLSGKIADALSKLPGEVVTTIGHARSTKSPVQEDVQMSRLLLKYSEIAEPLAAADITRLTKMWGHDQGLFKLLDRLIQNKASTDRTEESPLFSLGPTTEQIFEQLLGEIPIKSRDWARRVFTFILTSLRPLRVYEFHTVSQLCAQLEDPSYKPQWPTRGNSSTHHKVVRLLQSLQGLISIKNDEIHFSHPYLQLWLTTEDSSHDKASSRPWYWMESEINGHLNILEVSLAHFRNLSKSDFFYPLLPYAIEHWVSHYKVAPSPESDRLVRGFFNDEGLLELWLNAYALLSSSWAKPLPETRTPLCVAAHFGLENITKYFLDHEEGVGYTQEWERAMLEAIRAGELAAMRLLLQSAPRSLEFEDNYLQKAVLEASESDHVQGFREIVRHVPKARHPIPEWNSLQYNHTAENATDRGVEQMALNTTEGIESDESPYAPFRWLETVLVNACECGADDIVDMLLRLGANPDSTDPLGYSALATAWQCPQIVQVLLQQGADPERRSGPKKLSPLFTAAAGGSAEVVKLLLENGALVNAKDDDGLLPLHAACRNGNFGAAEIILEYTPVLEDLNSYEHNSFLEAVGGGSYKITEALLRHGFDPNCHDNNDRSALGAAIVSKNLALCELLLDHKADPNYTHGSSQPPLVLAVRTDSLDIAALLIRSGADVNKAWQPRGLVRLPLGFAAASGYVDIVRTLLENGADPNAADERDWNPLLLAASRGRTEVVHLLRAHDADLDFCGGDTRLTPLHASCVHPDIVRFLLESGANASKEDASSAIPLAYATRAGHLATMKLLISNSKTASADILHPSVKNELLKFTEWGPGSEERLSVLLEAGIDVNTTNSSNTSLVMLAMLNSEAHVRTILEYGPDLSIRNTEGDTVITMISEATSVGSIKRVLRLGAQLDVVDNNGWSPLIWAITSQNWDVFEYLMTIDSVRSSVNLLSNEGTALHFASYKGSVKAVEALLQNGADIDLSGVGEVGTPIMEAIMGRNDAVVQLLLRKGAQLDRPAGSLYLPTFAACLRGSPDLVRQLLEEHGLLTDIVDLLGRRQVHLACYNNVEVLEQLNPPHGDFSARDCIGRVPLHYACLTGDIELMKNVLERSKRVGVGIETQDKDGWTPLLWAARASSILDESKIESKHFDAVSWLISQGADATVRVDGIESSYERGGHGWTAAEIAQYHGAEKIVDLLRTHKSDGKSGQRSRRVGQVSSEYCDCCLITIRGRYFTCETCKHDYFLCFKCSRSKDILHPAHTMEQRGSEDVVHSSPIVHGSEAGSSVPSEDSDDEVIDLETVVATVQGPQSKAEE